MQLVIYSPAKSNNYPIENKEVTSQGNEKAEGSQNMKAFLQKCLKINHLEIAPARVYRSC